MKKKLPSHFNFADMIFEQLNKNWITHTHTLPSQYPMKHKTLSQIVLWGTDGLPRTNIKGKTSAVSTGSFFIIKKKILTLSDSDNVAKLSTKSYMEIRLFTCQFSPLKDAAILEAAILLAE